MRSATRETRATTAAALVAPERVWVRPVASLGGAIAILLMFLAEPGPGIDLRTSAWGVALMVAASLVPVARLRWPRVAAVGGAAMGVVLLTIEAGIAPASVLLAIALYTLVGRRSNRALWLGTAAAGVVVVALVGGLHGAWSMLLPALLIVGMGTAAADSTRVRAAYFDALHAQLDRLETTREAQARQRVIEERLRIARDLHDALAHQVAVINLHSGAASRALHDRPDAAEQSLATIRTAARTVLEEMSEILSVLRGPDAEQHDRAPRRPVGTLDDLDGLASQFGAAGLRVRLEVERDARHGQPTEAASMVAHRVVQEGLANALKHGSGGEAVVRMSSTPGRLDIEVTNPLAVEPHRERRGDRMRLGTGHGLIGLRERVESCGGSVQQAQSDGDLFRLVVRLPMRPTADGVRRPRTAFEEAAS